MRTPTKYRLIYFCIAVTCYVSGFLWLPEPMTHPWQPVLSYMYLGILFLVLPALFYLLVVKGGGQKLWRLLIPFSLGAVVARYTLPAAFAEHFEFISYLRYPLIAVILIIEFAVIFHVVSSLWKARKLSGDPRLHAITHYRDDEKKQSMAVMAASEPASYYYAIPYLSRNHPTALTNLSLLSASRWHICAMLTLLAILTVSAYSLIGQYSHLAAVIVTTLLCWSSVSLIASHRISRYYSAYISHDQLMINASFFSVLCVSLADISKVETGNWPGASLGDAVTIGRSDTMNLKLSFHREVSWMTMMATVVEPVHEIYLTVDTPAHASHVLKTELSRYSTKETLQQAG